MTNKSYFTFCLKNTHIYMWIPVQSWTHQGNYYIHVIGVFLRENGFHYWLILELEAKF